MPAVKTTPDVPPYEPDAKAERNPTDPITKHLWRFKRSERAGLLVPFVGQPVKIERWWGRVAANGDTQYKGDLLAVATTTTGSTADFAIVKTVDGTVWAISTAQIAYIELDKPVKPAGKAVAAAAKPRTAKRTTRKTPPEVIPDGAA